MSTPLSDIQLLLLDVDGVLTDGSITYTDTGEQIKQFCSSDGLGLRLLMDAGIQVGIITGRTSKALRYRCDNLNITLLFEGIRDKAGAIEKISARTKIKKVHMAYVGDDLIDLPAMKRVGVSFSVANACKIVKENCDHVTNACGGKGAVREICEVILKEKDLWQSIIDGYLS